MSFLEDMAKVCDYWSKMDCCYFGCHKRDKCEKYKYLDSLRAEVSKENIRQRKKSKY